MNSCELYEDVTLKNHQKIVVNFVRKSPRKGLILFHSVGSGKTILALTIARCLLSDKKIKRIVILTPVSVKNQWLSQFDRLKIGEMMRKVVIASHESLLKPGKIETEDSVLIIDEAHKFRTKITHKGEGKLANAMISKAYDAEKVIFLTATPYVNNDKDIKNMVIALNDFPDWESGYAGYHNDILCKFSTYTIDNRNNPNYPEVRIKTKNFEMDREYLREYLEIESGMDNDFYKGNPVPFYNGIRRAVNILDHNRESPKVSWVVKQVVAQAKRGMKSIVYSNWKRSGLDLIESHLKKRKIGYSRIDGSVSDRIRFEICDDYNRNELLIILISGAGSEGLDLKETRYIYILEPYWNETRILQTIGRGVRYKSHENLPPGERNVTVFNLILNKPESQHDEMPSGDAIVAKLMRDKQEKIRKFNRLIEAASIENKVNRCR